MSKARCTTCGWTIEESDLTPADIEFLGPGALGVWQAGEYHEYEHCEWKNGEPPEEHAVVLEPTGLPVELFRQVLGYQQN